MPNNYIFLVSGEERMFEFHQKFPVRIAKIAEIATGICFSCSKSKILSYNTIDNEKIIL